MKILIIHTRYLQSAGGEDSTVDSEAALLRMKGHEVSEHFFDNASIGKGIAGKIKAGVNFIYNPASAKSVGKKIELLRPDIIHVHNTFFAGSPSILYEAKRRGIPVVMTIQNYRFICANCLLLRNNKVCELCVNHAFPWYGVKYKCYHGSAVQSAMVGGIAAVHKWIGTWKNKVDLFITPSYFMRTRLLDSSFGISDDQIKVKRNFIPDHGIGAQGDRKDSYLFIGRLSAEKGVDTLLEAWKDLTDQQLLIVGDGPESEALQTEYGHLSHVQFMGKKTRAEVIVLMKQCRALIFPSIWYEGLPLTIVEAFSTGTPVIASSLGAMKEMILHQQNGLQFTPGDPKSLVAAVRFFNDTLSSGDFSFYSRARQSYLEHYYPESCYEQLIQMYMEVISKRSVRTY